MGAECFLFRVIPLRDSRSSWFKFMEWYQFLLIDTLKYNSILYSGQVLE